MPRKRRQLIAELKKHGFIYTSKGKGSHRLFTNPETQVSATMSGHDGDDAPRWLENHVRDKIRESEAKKASM